MNWGFLLDKLFSSLSLIFIHPLCPRDVKGQKCPQKESFIRGLSGGWSGVKGFLEKVRTDC